ncbi:expressed unknown protein [Seminavis robusta]|uniref:Uncharacterized protein n=1 Tax=Seminavis robusta TaxID=568900 RepID=A0A9N8HHY9_9STRA|nr:expressed unknown protein [Seminavis robusta]|eukprot:Sro742_g195870.1 n/a (370) ;mRNA; f:14070-15179
MSHQPNEEQESTFLWTPLVIPLGAIVLHFQGWSQFLASVSKMLQQSSLEEFSSALSFWFLGALSHPLMEAAFDISELLHASPGPRVLGLVPWSFLLGALVVGIALVQSDKLRTVVGSTCVAWVLAYMGAGLDGTTTGDYNIQLDDSYQGRVVQGCPSPELVQALRTSQQFDYQKYQGRWYWHKVHDWTQFHQMYDTTLDIQLTTDDTTSMVTGYINTLTIKGPSPENSPLAWDKSPLLQGVRYSWKGEIDTTSDNKNGVSQESGFGVTFPNYIIDVDKDYQELVQFQCIEVGGVRLYEGIDFMSRSPTMTDAQLDKMHQRARSIDPYGASPDQMQRIPQLQQQQQAEVDNAWQDLWKWLQVDRYLDQSL